METSTLLPFYENTNQSRTSVYKRIQRLWNSIDKNLAEIILASLLVIIIIIYSAILIHYYEI